MRGSFRPIALKLAPGVRQRGPTPLAGPQLLGQLVTALLTVELVLGRADAGGLLENLARELLVVEVCVMRGVGVQLGAVDRDQPDLDKPGLLAQREHLGKKLGKRFLVADAKARDRRVIGRLLSSDHAVGDVLHAAALDAARGALTPRVRVEQKRQHHLRLKRRATPPVLTIGGIKRREIQLPHGLQNEPRQVALGQPIARVRRHQKRLLTITPDEVLRHAQQSLNRPGQTGVCATPTTRNRSAGWDCCFSAKEPSWRTGSSVRSLLGWTTTSSHDAAPGAI